jgi:putative phosphoesterase
MNTSFQKKDSVLIGVISDTHGLMRPEALDALKDADLIIHAGDIGRDIILDELKSIAPVIAVRGNMDREGWAYQLPFTETVEIKDTLIHVMHELNRIDLDPETSGIRVIISGHTHKPAIVKQDGILFVNPGSAGPRRFRLPVSVALLTVNKKQVRAKIVELKV